MVLQLLTGLALQKTVSRFDHHTGYSCLCEASIAIHKCYCQGNVVITRKGKNDWSSQFTF